MKKLSIHLVTWNGEKYIPYLFASLRKQTFEDFKLIILDNGSTDGTSEAIIKELEYCNFEFEFIKSEENLGFVGGHNKLFNQTESEYIALLNQDMFLMPEFFRRLIATMDHHKDVGACSGRLMKWDFHLLEDRGADGLHRSFTQFIDTLGLKVFRSRRVVDWHAGDRWPDVGGMLAKDGSEAEVFGVSGALPIYRKSAIKDVLLEGEMFDSMYFSYKEDVDLAWRLRIAGHKAVIVTDAVAFHDRSAAGEASGDLKAAKNRKSKSALANYHSYKNHIYTVLKNEYISNYMKDWLWLEIYEWKKFLYLLFMEFKAWCSLKEVVKNRSNISRKRKLIKQTRKVSAKELRQWWTKKQK